MVKRLACCAFLAIVSGCTGSHQVTTTATRPPERPSKAQRPVPADATRITGGSLVERRELRALLRAFGSTGIAKLTIEPAGHPWTSRSKDAVVLRSTPHVKDHASEWEGIVISDEFAARSARAGLPPVVASEGPFGGMRINIGYRAKLPRWSPAAVRRAVEAAARAQDATVTVLRVATLNGRPVIRLQLRVDDPARFLAQRFSLVMTALPEHAAGQFVEVVGPAGYLANLSAGAGNLGMGGTAQAFESCGPGGFSDAIGYQPRPCPFTGPHAYASSGARPTRSVSDVAATAAAHLRDGESVTFLVVAPTAAELCRSNRIQRCPHVAGTTWVATLTKGSGRDRVDRWLMIADADGRVVASGASPN